VQFDTTQNGALTAATHFWKNNLVPPSQIRSPAPIEDFLRATNLSSSAKRIALTAWY